MIEKDESNFPDVEERLRIYFPSLFLLLKDKQFSWGRVNKIFYEEYLNRKAEYEANNNYLRMQAGFFDIISASLNGRSDALNLFAFFDNLISELAFRIPDKQKNWLKTTLYNVFTNWDRNYLNFFGELAVLNNFLKAGFTLGKIEERLSSGKEIDFAFFGLDQGKKVLIEIVNIHLEIFENKNDIEMVKLYRQKIFEKLKEKTNGSLADMNFSLIPVVWGSHEELLRLYSLYNKGITIENLNVIEPNCYMCYTYETGILNYFGRLSSMPSIDKNPKC
jgi:hypothetical protein